MGSEKPFDQLAVFGGAPAFAEVLHVGRPNIGDRGRLLMRVNDLLDRRWLTNHGPYVEELERRIAGMLGVKHCVAMCNGTIALEVAVRALGWAGEVIVPSMTFIATAHALRWLQITPVFCDVDPASHTLDPRLVEALVTPRTAGVIGVHVWGRPCEVDALTEIARRRGLGLLFDAAHAFACTSRGRMIGGFGDAEIFSFHATKFFNTFEGGAVVTNNDELAARVRLMQNFGFAGYDDVVCAGTNGKMSEIAAAMGLTSLESLDEVIAVNRRNHALYREGLGGIPGIAVLEFDETERCNYQYVVLEVDELQAAMHRDDLLRVLKAENVLARRYFYPGCHRMEPYRSDDSDSRLRLPVTETIVERVLQLPTGTAIGPDQIRTICGIIRLAASHGPLIRRRLHAVVR